MAEARAKRYVFSIRLMHILMAALIIFNIFLGIYTENLPKSNPSRATLWNFHYSIGVLVLLFAAERLFFRVFSQNPRNPYKLGRGLHAALYCLMFLMPVSGYLMASFGGRYVEFFGSAIPLLFAPNGALKAFFKVLHVYGGYTMIGVITAHIGLLVFLFFKRRPVAKALYKTIKLF